MTVSAFQSSAQRWPFATRLIDFPNRPSNRISYCVQIAKWVCGQLISAQDLLEVLKYDRLLKNVQKSFCYTLKGSSFNSRSSVPQWAFCRSSHRQEELQFLLPSTFLLVLAVAHSLRVPFVFSLLEFLLDFHILSITSYSYFLSWFLLAQRSHFLPGFPVDFRPVLQRAINGASYPPAVLYLPIQNRPPHLATILV